jgi:hypothetical protein
VKNVRASCSSAAIHRRAGRERTGSGATYGLGRGINRIGNEGQHRSDDEGGKESELHLGNGENRREGKVDLFGSSFGAPIDFGLIL